MAYLLLGPGYEQHRSFDEVSIEEDEESHGRVISRDLSWYDPEDAYDLGSLYAPGPLELRAGLEFQIMTSWAGTIAEQHFLGDADEEIQRLIDGGFGRNPIPGTDEAFALGDLDNIVTIAGMLAGGDFEAASLLVEYHRIRVENLVKQDLVWRIIEAIAQELLVRKTMTFDECKAVKDRTVRELHQK